MSELESFRSREENVALAGRLKVVVWVITAAVLALVGVMRRVKLDLPEGMSFEFLPPVHAVLNSLAAVALIGALVAIKGGRAALHQRFVNIAMLLSGLFLMCYVAYHFTTAETLYGDANRDGVVDAAEKLAAGGMRTFYLAILFSHIVLAAISLPFILTTYVYAYTSQFAKHRSLARRVFPIWLYVAVTGPVCYLLLRPFYG